MQFKKTAITLGIFALIALLLYDFYLHRGEVIANERFRVDNSQVHQMTFHLDGIDDPLTLMISTRQRSQPTDIILGISITGPKGRVISSYSDVIPKSTRSVDFTPVGEGSYTLYLQNRSVLGQIIFETTANVQVIKGDTSIINKIPTLP